LQASSESLRPTVSARSWYEVASLELILNSAMNVQSGLIPQAPLHTQSLVILGPSVRSAEDRLEMTSTEQPIAPTRTASDSPFRVATTGRNVMDIKRDIEVLEEELDQEKKVAVVEQRVSVLVQGIFCECL
jgi:hypothetical protein